MAPAYSAHGIPVAPHGFPEGSGRRLLTPPERSLCRIGASQEAPSSPSQRPQDEQLPFQPFPRPNQQAFSLAYKMVRPWLDTGTSGKIQVPCG